MLFVALWTSTAYGQKVYFEMNGAFVVPTSDLKDLVGNGGGGDVSIGYRINESWLAKLTVGYHQFAEETLAQGVTSSGAFVPIRIGAVKLWGESKRFYTSPGLGIYSGSDDFEGSKFGIGPKLGFLIPISEGKMALDIGLEFHNVFTDPENSRYLAVTIGIAFNAGE